LSIHSDFKIREFCIMGIRLFAMGVVATAVATAASADAPKYDFADVFYQAINDPSGSGFRRSSP
jgi:hypothetical protein